MNAKLYTGILFCTALLLASCAPGPNELADTISTAGRTAGFWLGLWHGAISPLTFVISLFTDHVQIYEVHNTGGWYNLGFLLGASCSLGGGACGGSKACGVRK